MTVWFHSTILATGLAATVAVGIAGAAVYTGFEAPVAAKADRLPVAAATAGDKRFVTLETRGNGMSVLSRVPLTQQAAE
jgi:hypothetical protein